MTTKPVTTSLAMKKLAATGGIIENATVSTMAIDATAMAAKRITDYRAIDLTRAVQANILNDRPAATIRRRAIATMPQRLAAIMPHRSGRGRRDIGRRATTTVTGATTATTPITGTRLTVIMQRAIIGRITATTRRMATMAARSIIAAMPRIMPIMHGTTTCTGRTSTTVARTAGNRLTVTIMPKPQGGISRRHRIVGGAP